MSSSNSPCAACKFLRRKCTQECVFAPYFPPDQPQKFANVHKVFGASNVAKILNELSATQREDAVNSLAYEAEARLRDPVYGCVGLISILQQRLKQVQLDLYNARKELATYMGPQAMLSILQPASYTPQQIQGGNAGSSSAVVPYNMSPMMGIPTGAASGQLMVREQQQHQQIYEAQQLLAAREQQEMLRSFEQNKQGALQSQEAHHLRFNSGFDTVTGTGLNQMSPTSPTTANNVNISPALALGFDSSYQIQAQQQQEPHHHHHHHHLQLQAFLQSQQQQQQPPQLLPQKVEGEEGRSRSVGPSC
ncbi:LOB domain-containing protein 36 [Argentina anserina]|uniref:LOB domain-containing protein 36 n=1 Tax=Argentina anserina TaxID=57926 RepID=UPI0021761F05|nr:LOB domain-containing protein 36 [Potentilla anserina]